MIAISIWEHPTTKKILASKASIQFQVYMLRRLSKRMYSISALAQKFNLSESTIKTYIKIKQEALDIYLEKGFAPDNLTHTLTNFDVLLYKRMNYLLTN